MIKKIAAALFLLAIIASVLYVIIHRENIRHMEEDPVKFREAMHYDRQLGGILSCHLCPKNCVLSPGQYGNCRARKNIGGKLYSLVYGRIAANHVDPIEKKPFFHVLPGEAAFSIATTGCNIHCLFCQNWEISQVFPFASKTQEATPEEVVAAAVASRSKAIAFTYSEPIIAYEYVMDIVKLARPAGLKTLMISNGYINEKPLRELLPYIDAFKVDLKGFDEKFYQRLTQGSLQPVLTTMKIIKDSGVWLEIVNLLITGQNDSPEQVRALSRWVHENLGDDVPLHFSRFHPAYRLLNVPPTPFETVVKARQIAMEEGLRYVYTGNIVYLPGGITYCPRSGQEAIIRQGMLTVYNGLRNGMCSDGERIPGLWQ